MALDLAKLAKICAMFASEFPDERATAAAIADRMVRSSGSSWEIIFRALDEAAQRIADLQAEAEAARQRQPGTTPVREWRELWVEPDNDPSAIEACLEWGDIMSEWEQGFLVSVSGRDRLSEKQKNVLWRLVAKARAKAKAEGFI